MQTVVVTGKYSKEVAAEGFAIHFSVGQYRDYDTNTLKSYEQTFKELKESVTKLKLDSEMEFVKRFADDFPGRDNFGLFRIEVPTLQIANRVCETIKIDGVEVTGTKYSYPFDLRAIRAELTPKAIEIGKLRAQEIASGMGMRLGRVIQVQDSDPPDAILDRETDAPTQKASCVLYLIFELLSEH